MDQIWFKSNMTYKDKHTKWIPDMLNNPHLAYILFFYSAFSFLPLPYVFMHFVFRLPTFNTL